MADATYATLQDQLANMLGADSASDLPTSDKTRIGIFVNQAYRECYLPVDGRRPRWATKQFKVSYAEGVESADLDVSVVDLEKVPELEGHGPLSPFNSPQDEIRVRSTWKDDFRPYPGRAFGNMPTFDSNTAESGRPLWYWVDQTDADTDDDGIGDDATTGVSRKVQPRLHVYPVPDKAYTVKIFASVVPTELTGNDDVPRLPGAMSWDILLPMALGKLLVDPRYNGANKEFIMRAAEEAKQKLKTLTKPQKQSTTRIGLRRGW